MARGLEISKLKLTHHDGQEFNCGTVCLPSVSYLSFWGPSIEIFQILVVANLKTFDFDFVDYFHDDAILGFQNSWSEQHKLHR